MKGIFGLAVLAWPLTLMVMIGLAFFVVMSLAVWFQHSKAKHKPK